jgi:hypothetical protein
MAMSVEDYALLMAHFQLEASEGDRETAKARARENLQSLKPTRRR